MEPSMIFFRNLTISFKDLSQLNVFFWGLSQIISCWLWNFTHDSSLSGSKSFSLKLEQDKPEVFRINKFLESIDGSCFLEISDKTSGFSAEKFIRKFDFWLKLSGKSWGKSVFFDRLSLVFIRFSWYFWAERYSICLREALNGVMNSFLNKGSVVFSILKRGLSRERG